jgi:hypothetical protein
MKEIIIIFLGFFAVCYIALVINRHEINKARQDYQAYSTAKKNLLEGIDK